MTRRAYHHHLLLACCSTKRRRRHTSAVCALRLGVYLVIVIIGAHSRQWTRHHRHLHPRCAQRAAAAAHPGLRRQERHLRQLRRQRHVLPQLSLLHLHGLQLPHELQVRTCTHGTRCHALARVSCTYAQLPHELQVHVRACTCASSTYIHVWFAAWSARCSLLYGTLAPEVVTACMLHFTGMPSRFHESALQSRDAVPPAFLLLHVWRLHIRT